MNSDFTLAIHSLTYLALQPDRMSTSNAISESAGVHPVRIRKVLSLLKKHKFIQSKEGIGGGFIFARNLSEVNLWHIYQITSEGALQPKCPESNDQCIVGSNMRKVLFTIFLGAEEHLGEYLKNYTMKEVVDLINQER
ncbi:Rrf2-family transcriptional regulator SaiR [Bacillus toyonensis]|uniref:Transcriptional regulator n=1 Tax=Bacillus toyonensis TaxID=155322 RepID=A0A2C4QWS1_9BACI|nr:Rrf2-family transcriptional regulator SaiR [Bacillus toyonensis]MDT3499063.1 Rrf2-family transcriptional regulator SaiR [Bacillus toyonensis]PGA95415.1 transcriptional regulator [Bacillus toyonensis]PHD68882.1 transcriptional regulator [Bacillus toyonensis]HDX9609659.1 Rrf2 family transcriptional regulator [Bacillus toyonensis]